MSSASRLQSIKINLARMVNHLIWINDLCFLKFPDWKHSLSHDQPRPRGRKICQKMTACGISRIEKYDVGMLLFFTRLDRLRKVKIPFDKIPPCPGTVSEVGGCNQCLFISSHKQTTSSGLDRHPITLNPNHKEVVVV